MAPLLLGLQGHRREMQQPLKPEQLVHLAMEHFRETNKKERALIGELNSRRHRSLSHEEKAKRTLQHLDNIIEAGREALTTKWLWQPFSRFGTDLLWDVTDTSTSDKICKCAVKDEVAVSLEQLSLPREGEQLELECPVGSDCKAHRLIRIPWNDKGIVTVKDVVVAVHGFYHGPSGLKDSRIEKLDKRTLVTQVLRVPNVGPARFRLVLDCNEE